jgi:hypothetical protein
LSVIGLASHKGYATPKHLAALREFGPTPLHRQSFAPVWQNPVPQEAFAFMGEDDPGRDSVEILPESYAEGPEAEIAWKLSDP